MPPTFNVTDLGTLGGLSSVAARINAPQQSAGSSTGSDGKLHAFLWTDGVMTDLGTLGPGQESQATDMNDQCVVTGYSGTSTTPPNHAFLYQAGQFIDLGVLPGDTESEAYAINNAGHVVGVSRTQTATYLMIPRPGRLPNEGNNLYASTDLSATAWTQQPFPPGGPELGRALATGANADGWVFDTSVLWRRVDPNTYVQIVPYGACPSAVYSNDFYTFPPFVPPATGGTTVVGISSCNGQGQMQYVKSTDGGVTASLFSFGNLPFPPETTDFYQFWVDERTFAHFLVATAELVDPQAPRVPHLYYSTDLQTWGEVSTPNLVGLGWGFIRTQRGTFLAIGRLLNPAFYGILRSTGGGNWSPVPLPEGQDTGLGGLELPRFRGG